MEFVTVAQLAKRINYSRCRIYQLIEAGIIRTEGKVGDVIIISKAEAEKWARTGSKWNRFPRPRKRKAA